MATRSNTPPREWQGLSRAQFAALPLGTRVENWEFPDTIFAVVQASVSEPRIRWVSGATDALSKYGRTWRPGISWCRVAPWPTHMQLPAGV